MIMKRFKILSLLTLCLFMISCSQGSLKKDEFVSLFDGKTLKGWRGYEKFWSVKDGVIVGKSSPQNKVSPNTFLIHEKEVADFELHFEYRFAVAGNSGVQYRSRVLDEKKFSVGGYQGDFEAGKKYTGILYEERGRGILANRGQQVVIDAKGKKKAQKKKLPNVDAIEKIKLGDWVKYIVIAKGNHLQHFVNGVKTIDVIDNQVEKRKMKGVLAFQMHQGNPMEIQFRNIKIKTILIKEPSK
jgi:hypothetical protein